MEVDINRLIAGGRFENGEVTPLVLLLLILV